MRYKSVGVADKAIHLAEFMLVEYGQGTLPLHLVDEVDALVKMLLEFELEPLRDLWWSGARDSHPGEGDVFVVRCASFFRAIDAKMKSRFGAGLQELSDASFADDSDSAATMGEAPPGWRTVGG